LTVEGVVQRIQLPSAGKFMSFERLKWTRRDPLSREAEEIYINLIVQHDGPFGDEEDISMNREWIVVLDSVVDLKVPNASLIVHHHYYSTATFKGRHHLTANNLDERSGVSRVRLNEFLEPLQGTIRV
jgi:hypothetical protein